MSVIAPVWSTSKADTAAQCLYKYKRVYIDKVKEESHALTLGSVTHDVIANELLSMNTDENVLIEKLDDMGGVDPELYAMVPNINKFCVYWCNYVKEHDLEPTIEQKYAMTRDCKRTGFLDSDAYIRGVFDLWAFDERRRKLIVIDHKTSKALSSADAVKAHSQLNLYVYMLTKMNNLEWDTADIALHFVRHGKNVWAYITRKDMEEFGARYMHFLAILEERITKAYETNNWERCPGFHCKWCSFKGECVGHI